VAKLKNLGMTVTNLTQRSKGHEHPDVRSFQFLQQVLIHYITIILKELMKI